MGDGPAGGGGGGGGGGGAGGGGGGGRTLTATPNSADLDSCKTLMKTFIKEHPEIWNEASVPRLQRSGGCVLTCDTRRLQDIGEE